jgi:acetylserotonin N-methyltransferase
LGTLLLPSVTVADELGLLAALATKPLSTAALAVQLGVGPRGVEALASILCNLSLLKKNKDAFALTPVSRKFLLPNSEFYWGVSIHRFRQSEDHKRIREAVQKESAFISHEGKTFTEMWEVGDVTPAAAEEFSARMHIYMLSNALVAAAKPCFKRSRRVLDVGGGSGAFSLALAMRLPKLACTVFELPAVCHVTQQYINRYGMQDRVHLLEGNFFRDPLPRGFDTIVFSNIFHDWPMDRCEHLLRVSHTALPRNGQIVLHEMLLDNAKTGPRTPLLFSLLMYINHGAQQFSALELRALLKKCGFGPPSIVRASGDYSLVAAKRI